MAIKAYIFGHHGYSNTCEILAVRHSFSSINFSTSYGGTWENVTHYILAAQTIYYKHYLTKQVFADHPKSVGAWRQDTALKYWRIQFVRNRRTSARLSGSFRLYAHTSSKTCVVRNQIIDCSFDSCSIKWEC